LESKLFKEKIEVTQFDLYKTCELSLIIDIFCIKNSHTYAHN